MLKKTMEEHISVAKEKECTAYATIGQLVTKKFIHNIFEPDIVTTVMNALPPEEINHKTEETIKHIIFNRQLMAERFL